MNIQPFGAVIIGTVAGTVSTLGYQYLTPFLKSVYLHDTCGVNNLHGMPGLLSGVIGAIVAFSASRDSYNGNRFLHYPCFDEFLFFN
jgi:ammonium transporter Rh